MNSDTYNGLAEPPAGQLRFASPEVTTFTTDLLVATAKLFPSSLISTGGDELNVNCYQQDLETQQILNSTKQTLFEALSNFTATTHGELIKEKKTPVVWEGVLPSRLLSIPVLLLIKPFG